MQEGYAFDERESHEVEPQKYCEVLVGKQSAKLQTSGEEWIETDELVEVQR